MLFKLQTFHISCITICRNLLSKKFLLIKFTFPNSGEFASIPEIRYVVSLFCLLDITHTWPSLSCYLPNCVVLLVCCGQQSVENGERDLNEKHCLFTLLFCCCQQDTRSISQSTASCTCNSVCITKGNKTFVIIFIF
jgi:hypothetical protein